MAGVAAGIVRRNFDPAFADRRGPHEIDGEPREMGQAVVDGGAFDRTRDQGRGRPGVLVLGIPRTAGQFAGAKGASAEIDISRVQGGLHAPLACRGGSTLDVRRRGLQRKRGNRGGAPACAAPVFRQPG